MQKIGLPFLIFSMVFVTCERDEPASEKIPKNDPVTEAPEYVPSDFKGNELAPLHGIDYGRFVGIGSTPDKVINYGRGMSAMIKFLSLEFPYLDLTWANSYNDLIMKGVSPAANLIDALNAAYIEVYSKSDIFENHTYGYWNKFLNDYLTQLP